MGQIQIGGKILEYDDTATSIITVPFDHHELHEGDRYVATGTVTLGTVNETHDIAFNTPNSADLAHMVIDVYSSGASNYVLYEGGTVSGGGTVASYNRNRSSANTASVTVLGTPSVSATGTAIFEHHQGAGRDAGISRDKNEWMLAANQTYLMRITAEATSNDVNWTLEWYEHGA